MDIKLLTSCFLTCLSLNALADPCNSDSNCYDPDYGSSSITNFNNQFHYVFIGSHPDDELMIYPQLKNFCAENNAYCAMIIGSRGRHGCDSSISNPTQCGVIRAAELRNSARYLESDLWHFDLPGGPSEISPYTWSGVQAAFNNSSIAHGYTGTVDLLKSKLSELKTPTSTLVVVTHDPAHGSSGHLTHMVIADLVDQALNQLPNEFSAHRLYIDTSVNLTSWGAPYLTTHGTPGAQCVNGSNYLTVTNKNLTNFQVFDYGYNEIYKSQFWHLGTNYSNSSSYNFCTVSF